MSDEQPEVQPLSAEELAKIERLASAATPGPWRETISNDDALCIGLAEHADLGPRSHLMVVEPSARCYGGEIEFHDNPDSCADRAFIAASREAVPRLLATCAAWGARVRILDEAAERLDDAITAILNYRDAERKHPLDGPLLVEAFRASSFYRKEAHIYE